MRGSGEDKMPGYSGTPLPKKLGIKPGHRVLFLNGDEAFTKELGELPEDVRVSDSLRGRIAFDVIVFFTKQRSELQNAFPKLVERLVSNGGLWIAWPKKAAKVPTDLTEDVIRDIGLDAGLVDVKVCAITEIWSGLKFVIRVNDRVRA
jgi:hypothetical protein